MVAVSRARYGPGMRRFVDVVLIVIVLGVVGFGAYAIGHRVDHESNSLASSDPELNSTKQDQPEPGTPQHTKI